MVGLGVWLPGQGRWAPDWPAAWMAWLVLHHHRSAIALLVVGLLRDASQPAASYWYTAWAVAMAALLQPAQTSLRFWGDVGLMLLAAAMSALLLVMDGVANGAMSWMSLLVVPPMTAVAAWSLQGLCDILPRSWYPARPPRVLTYQLSD